MRDDARSIRVQMWKPVREVFQAADALFVEASRLRAVAEAEGEQPGARPVGLLPGKPAAPPPPGKPAAPPLPGPPAAYARRRHALREVLEAGLDPALTDHLGLWQKHLCVTVIASFIDEQERVALGALAETWRLPLLQTELLEIDDGGDRCFVQLAELLTRADVHVLVFEIHLLCLRAGFVGRYRDRRHELAKLTERLVERVRQDQPRRAALVVGDAPAPARRRVGFVGFPLRYYVGVAVLGAGLFVALRVISNREVQHSNLAAYCHYHDDGDAP
jgi:hypothetical protein